MRKLLIQVSVLLSVWKLIQQSRKDAFLKRLQIAQAALAAAVFHSQVAESNSNTCNQHLPPTAATQEASQRSLMRETTALDWTSAAAAAQAEAGSLPDGFHRSKVSLRAAQALHPCNASIPVLLLWHESFLPTGLPPSRCTSLENGHEINNGSAATKAAAGGEQEAAAQPAQQLPVVVWLHATGGSKEDMVPRMEAYAQRGFLAVAMDCRYHGERIDRSSSCPARVQYEDAMYRAWSSGAERPFLLDNVRDLSTLLNFLTEHPHVDPQRIGMSGVSLGGMHTWLCAAVDARVAAAAPLIGVQSFLWAVSNNSFHGRVNNLQHAFKQICNDCAKECVDAAVVQNVWHRLLPGLEDYDAALSLPCIAPRPLLVVNGELDPRCPIEGLKGAFAACEKAYRLWGCEGNLVTHIEPGARHEVTTAMDQLVEQFFAKHLLSV